ncbi:MAG: amidohydrolase family protein [Burkholderiales bacterium]|nr:amidohydrolase family protein [Burkholderiales bacterium]
MHDENLQPAFISPAGACDTHFHVFGPLAQYPVASLSRYIPPLAPLEDYLALAKKLGMERLVFVQPSAYGTDNRCMLDAMARVKLPRLGIADIDEDMPDAEIEALHALGVRGVRINTSPVAPFDPGRVNALLGRITKLESRLKGLGWVLEFLGPGWLTHALMPTMRKLDIDFILCHIGMFLAKDGVDQPGFRDLLKLLEGGHCWPKLTAPYRFATAPDFADAAPLVRAVAKVAPDRLIWGSDYPHLSFADKVGSVQLFNLLGEWLPEETLRRKVLVENPEKLFGFGKP